MASASPTDTLVTVLTRLLRTEVRVRVRARVS